ncbi:MAG: polyphosphate polymerase domain-containing protein [Bacteroides sp.]|jgi:hypothetical protein|nr:polyphosphate polymerase domain-containing protein [Bacteroides sp.]
MSKGYVREEIIDTLNSFHPIGLDKMGSIKLMNRVDTKYILSWDTLTVVLQLAMPDYRVQEVMGERDIAYRTIYLDTLDKAMYRAHQNGRAVREKIRVRTYVSSSLTFLEVKNKDNKGRTDKKRIRVSDLGSLSDEGGDQFLSSNAWYRLPQLAPQIENSFRRITLVNNAMTERLTIDTEICFQNLINKKTTSLPHIVVMELKQDGHAYSPISEILHALHVRPGSFSKYCMGCALTDNALKQNRFKPKIHKLSKYIQ